MSKFLLVVLLLTVASVSSAAACDSGWSEFGDACYKAFAEQRNQYDSAEACHAEGAQLVSVHSESELKFLIDLAVEADPDDNYYFWTGIMLARHHLTHELMSCYNTDGTAFDYGECKDRSGKFPWTYGNEGNEPNFSKCVAIAPSNAKDPSKGWTGLMDHDCELDYGYGRTRFPYGYMCKK